jgi:hypothetical protein
MVLSESGLKDALAIVFPTFSLVCGKWTFVPGISK